MTQEDRFTKSSKTFISRIFPVVLLAAATTVSGCAHYTSRYAGVEIDSEPQGAEVVYVDTGVVLGTTPFKYWWETTSSEKRFINVRFQKPGYNDKTTAFYINPRHKSHEAALGDPHHVKITLDKSN